jgi:hypothetical protein
LGGAAAGAAGVARLVLVEPAVVPAPSLPQALAVRHATATTSLAWQRADVRDGRSDLLVSDHGCFTATSARR